MTENSAREGGEPAGEVYDWYVRGRTLLEGGNPEAAAELLRHAFEREPESGSVLEAFARALFDARRYGEAADRFTELVETSPDNDYLNVGGGFLVEIGPDFSIILDYQGHVVRSDSVEHFASVTVSLRF